MRPPRCMGLWFDFVEFVHDITALNAHQKCAGSQQKCACLHYVYFWGKDVYIFTITEGKYNSLIQWNTACSWWKGELIDNLSGLQFFERHKSTYIFIACRDTAVKPNVMDSTPLMWTPHYYGQFALSGLGKESPIFYLNSMHPLSMNMLLIWNFSLASSVSILMGFDFTLHQKFVCIFIWQEISNQRKWSAAPSASGSCLFIADRYQRISLWVIRDLSAISRREGGGGEF